MAQTGGDELEAVKKYFNTSGFERWNKIYGETDEVNKVQLDIRKGHAQTVEKVLAWFDADRAAADGASPSIAGRTVCDAGCGTGSLTLPLAERGAKVSASDISAAMVGEAERRFRASPAANKEGVTNPVFEAKDLESVSGKYDTVCCLDVMIHYPQDKADAMVGHLASLAERRVVVSFAPYTPQYALLKRIGELFPGPAKATRAYLHRESDVEAALQRAGFKVTRREMTATSFYFSRLLEAVRV
jgi:magnesium-protoporphyrin O-methyltransferase